MKVISLDRMKNSLCCTTAVERCWLLFRFPGWSVCCAAFLLLHVEVVDWSLRFRRLEARNQKADSGLLLLIN
jgi:hypothetical protein